MKLLFMVVLAVLAVFAACQADVSDHINATAEQTQEETTQEDGTTTEEGTQALTQETPLADARQELLAFFDRQDGLSYTVEYDISALGQTMRMTHFVDIGGVRVRSDMDAQGIRMRTIFDGENAYSCMHMGSWSCFAASDDDTDMPDTTSTEAREEFEADESLSVTRIQDRTVAGELTQCFVFETPDAEVEQCFSAQGVPLYVQTSADGHTTEVTATSYSLSVPQGAFDLPAQPGSMEDMMGGFDASAWGY